MLPDNINKNCGIYRIYNKSNGKFYIGSSKNIKQRKQKHFYQLNKNNHKNDYLQNAWNSQQNKEDFDFQVFIYCKEHELILLEQKCIDIMNPHYNESRIAGRPDLNENTRKKISKSVKNYLISLGDNHPSKRPEVREKMSLSSKGRPKTKESIEKQKHTKASPNFKCPNKSIEKRTKHSELLKSKGEFHASKRDDVRKKMKDYWRTGASLYTLWYRSNVMHQYYWGA